MKAGLLRTVVGGACLLALLLGAANAVAKGGVDRSFGHDGVARPPLVPGYRAQDVADWAVGPGGDIYLLIEGTQCLDADCPADLRLLRLTPDGALDTGFGEPGSGVLVARSEFFRSPSPTLAVGPGERAVVAFTGRESTSLVAVDGDGSVDRSFGGSGTVSLGWGCCDAIGQSLFVDGAGEITYVVNVRQGSTALFETGVTRLAPDGAPTSFNGGGTAAVSPAEGREPSNPLLLPGGSLLLPETSCCDAPTFHLDRITRNGRLDSRFAARSAAALAAVGLGGRDLVSLLAAVRRKGGRIDLYGSTVTAGFVLRLHVNGGLDRSFGRNGIRRTKLGFRSVAASRRGRVFAIGPPERGREPAAARALWFQRDGRIDRSWAAGHAVRLKAWGESLSGGTVEMQGARPVALAIESGFCRSWCQGYPQLIRFTAAPRPRHRR